MNVSTLVVAVAVVVVVAAVVEETPPLEDPSLDPGCPHGKSSSRNSQRKNTRFFNSLTSAVAARSFCLEAALQPFLSVSSYRTIGRNSSNRFRKSMPVSSKTSLAQAVSAAEYSSRRVTKRLLPGGDERDEHEGLVVVGGRVFFGLAAFENSEGSMRPPGN